jgi:hypothetical protein
MKCLKPPFPPESIPGDALPLGFDVIAESL